jgi:hypothetical protein
MYNNTVIAEHVPRSPTANVHWRNNLFLGRDTPDRGIMLWWNATGSYSSDYDGYRLNRGVARQFLWRAPVRSGQRGTNDAEPDDWKAFRTLAELSEATGQERHGIEVDFDIFEGLAPPDPALPRRHAVYHAMDLDFRLKAGARAVDAGQPLPTVNDDFTGRAPDLGALEVGRPVPHYGPRWVTRSPFYR